VIGGCGDCLLCVPRWESRGKWGALSGFRYGFLGNYSLSGKIVRGLFGVTDV